MDTDFDEWKIPSLFAGAVGSFSYFEPISFAEVQSHLSTNLATVMGIDIRADFLLALFSTLFVAFVSDFSYSDADLAGRAMGGVLAGLMFLPLVWDELYTTISGSVILGVGAVLFTTLWDFLAGYLT